jgi:hypothetical protein
VAVRGHETVTVVRKAKVDKLKPASGPTDEFDVKRCELIPRASNETEGGWVQISGYTVVAPGEADIRADDQLRILGDLYSVIGKPGFFRKKGRPVATIVTTSRSA